jgi:hypothetical protein
MVGHRGWRRGLLVAPGGGDQVVARLDPARLHLFDPGNGAHLTL